MKYLVILVLFLSGLSLTACTILSAEEESLYRSRTYPLAQSVTFEAVHAQLKQYTMAIDEADLVKGLIKTQPGGPGHGLAFGGGTVGYQVTVHVDALSPSSSRVTPAWSMNVSSDPFRPQIVAVPIEHRPILYVEFFNALDERLGLPKQGTR